MNANLKISAPTDPNLASLCETLEASASAPDAWPAAGLAACAERGIYEWFAPPPWGQGWSGAAIAEGYLHLAAASLTTTFILTQITGALRRIVESDQPELRDRVLPDLVRGKRLATLGISHLTTSRQHLGRPALMATCAGDEFVLQGMSPWVTGAPHVDFVLTGAVLEDGQQLLILVPTDTAGLTIPPAEQLVALTGSQTGRVEFDQVRLSAEWVVAGPGPDVMQKAAGARTGGLQTSTLALGLASAAIGFIKQQSTRRADLIHPAEQLQSSWEALAETLRVAADGGDISKNELRTQANSLVLRATQAALSAAKGAGFLEGHPAGRWCREALFFLVWSCPQPVVDANLCEFAGIET